MRGSSERGYPFSLDLPVPPGRGPLRSVTIVGVFSRFADHRHESAGTLGASVHLMLGRDIVDHIELVNGTHYNDAANLSPRHGALGDGTDATTLGSWNFGAETLRVDALTIPIVTDTAPTSVRFKDLGSPASFVVFDAVFAFEPQSFCPFHTHGGVLPLSEIPAIVRVGDRGRLEVAIETFRRSIDRADDLDEARGLSLTFLAMVTAATLELGGSRAMHRVQLDAARELDQLQDGEAIFAATRRRIIEVADFLTHAPASHAEKAVNRALEIVDRNYGADLSDASVANQLGLSTSHFRFLFKQSTGQPFHKYLIAVRLEKARQMLADSDLPIGMVAKTVGFSGLSHFSRAFSNRFNVAPSEVRRGAPE